jgi:hypothetical protein
MSIGENPFFVKKFPPRCTVACRPEPNNKIAAGQAPTASVIEKALSYTALTKTSG